MPNSFREKLPPALEIIAHSCLNRNTTFSEIVAQRILDHIPVAQQLLQLIARLTVRRAAMLDTQVHNGVAQVIPCKLIYILALGTLPSRNEDKQSTLF